MSSTVHEIPMDDNHEMIDPASFTDPSKEYMVEPFSPSLYATVESNPQSECNNFGPTLNKVNAPLPNDVFAGRMVY